MNKLPPLNKSFWIMKISATTLGETAGDLLSMTFAVGYAASSGIFVALLALALVFQLKATTYMPVVYWAAILLTSTAGTTMSDYMDRTLGLGYATGAAILLAILAGIFIYWYRSDHSMSVERIRTRKVEVMYWTAILFSNTLGTAMGDFLSDNSGLGFFGGAVLVGALLIITVLAYFHTRVSRVLLFWVAFVLTRPFGATMGDVLTKSYDKGGLNLGTVYSSLVLASILGITILYVYFTRTREAPGHSNS
jgi:uncharacterized membrane-anchored protein